MRILICGSRDWTDAEPIYSILYSFYDHPQNKLVVIEGCARGADKIAHYWNQSDNDFVEHLHFPANWSEHGKAAGPIRNRQMLSEGKPELVVAFHDNLATSKGTKDMVTIAKKAGVPVWVMKHG